MAFAIFRGQNHSGVNRIQRRFRIQLPALQFHRATDSRGHAKDGLQQLRSAGTDQSGDADDLATANAERNFVPGMDRRS